MRGIRSDGGSKQGNMIEWIAKMQTYCQFQVHMENKRCNMKVKSFTETQIEKQVQPHKKICPTPAL